MSKDLKKLKILLIDDDRFLLDIYSLKFKKLGVEIDSSASSVTALQKLKEGKEYDIVVIDIIMPGLDGIEFLRTLRKEKILPKAVIIMLTNQSDDEGKAKDLGVDGYIIKSSTIPSEVCDLVFSIYQNKNK